MKKKYIPKKSRKHKDNSTKVSIGEIKVHSEENLEAWGTQEQQ